jgi:hypothetical protein
VLDALTLAVRDALRLLVLDTVKAGDCAELVLALSHVVAELDSDPETLSVAPVVGGTPPPDESKLDDDSELGSPVPS